MIIAKKVKIGVKKIRLAFIVFTTSSCLMILEMIGSRILDPYFGSNINTWTILIGVILASLSIGYWLGGKIADSKRDINDILMKLVGFFGMSILAIVLLKEFLIYSLLSIKGLSIVFGCFIAVLLLFLVPGVLCGMITPIAVKIKLKTLANSGSSAGNLYAISTVGSIFGTFIAGFYLIPHWGSSIVLVVMGLVLISTSLCFAPDKLVFMKILIITLGILYLQLSGPYFNFLKKRGLVQIETSYRSLLIYQLKNKKGRMVSFLVSGANGYESSKTKGDFTPYLPNFGTLINSLIQKPANALVLGGGTMSISNFLLQSYPQLYVDSIEIDSKIVDIAKQYFDHVDNERHRAIIQDGRVFLNAANRKYDLIISDVYLDITPPFHLFTKEAALQVFRLLDNKGVYLVNVASALEGENSWLFTASYHTLLSIFPSVMVVPIEKGVNPKAIQSIAIIATKNTSPEMLKKMNTFGAYDTHLTTGQILTDDFAPIEYNVSLQAREKPKFNVSFLFLKELLNSTRLYLLGA